MLEFSLILLLIPSLVIARDVTQQEIKPIKGVPVSKYFLFQPTNGNKFKCLDGSRIIDYSMLNDDYCDCSDGSDEPGTSACSNSQFFCQNTGHSGNYIPSSRVNDKLCDCCDGSDEDNSGISCPNICDELGRAARIEKERIAVIARKGFAKRQELAKEGKQLRDEKLRNVEPLKTEKLELEPKLKELEMAKKVAEELEKKMQDAHRDKWTAAREEKKKIRSAELFSSIDANKDQKIDLDELKTLEYIDTDHDGLISSDEAKTYLGEDESVDFEKFHLNIFDRLVSARKSFQNEKELNKELEEEKAKAEEYAGEEADDDDLLEEKDRNHQNENSDNDDDDNDDQMPPYPEECQSASNSAVEARRLFDEVNSKVQDIDSKIREAEEFSSADYGEDLAWAALKGKCFERNVQQYTYVFCPFGQNTQKDTGASWGTNLGNFKSWNGPEKNKYKKQKYDEGQQCWNGPKRSTDVEIECGEEHELIEVTEPAKCEYHFVFRTPLACHDPDRDSIHEEL